MTKQFIAPIQGSAAAADPLEGQVPLVVDMISDGRISGPWKSKLWSLEVFRAVDMGAHIPGFALVADLPRLARDIHQYTR